MKKIACPTCHSTGQMDWTSGPFTCDECGGSGEIDERMGDMTTTDTNEMKWTIIPVEGDDPTQFDYLCEEYEWFIYNDGDVFILHKGVDETGFIVTKSDDPEKLKRDAQTFHDIIDGNVVRPASDENQMTPMASLQSRLDQMLRVLSALVKEGHLLSPETDGGDGFTTSLFREDFSSPEDFEWFKDFIASEQ